MRLEFACTVCDWSVSADPDPKVTIRTVNWHVYTNHPAVWRETNGDYVPPPAP